MAHSDETQRLLRCFQERLSLDEVRALLDGGADLQAVDPDGNTPLHEAVKLATTGVAALLIERGAVVDAKNASHQRPIDLALGRPTENARAFIPVLLAAGADIGHLIASDVPAELRDLFPELPAKRKPQLVRVPGGGRAGILAWVEGARDFIADGRPWRYHDPATRLDAAWREFLLQETWEGTLLVSIASRLRQLPEEDQREIEEQFRRHWAATIGSLPAEAPDGGDEGEVEAAAAIAGELVDQVTRMMQGDEELVHDVDPGAALQKLERARSHLARAAALEPAALAAVMAALERAIRAIETSEDTGDILRELAAVSSALASISGRETT